MSHHHKLRKEHTCLNCGHEVDDRYCPHCGQENIEPRQPFHYLFGHVMEDLTHYDHGFWETFKTLIARPGKLIKNYLAGRRASQVPPVKLYIFVSFVAFFLPSLLFGGHEYVKKSHSKEKHEVASHQQTALQAIDSLKVLKDIPLFSDAQKKEIQFKIDSINKIQKEKQIKDSTNGDDDDDLDDIVESAVKDTSSSINLSPFYNGYKSVEQIDSVQNSLPSGKRPNAIVYSIQRRYVELREDGVSNKEIIEKFIESFLHNLPKLLLFYLPVFAFFMWLFNNKKKWYYFDNGVFTLYYFSFLLTITILFELALWLGGFVHGGWINIIKGLLLAALIIYPFIYFFLAQHRVYGGSRFISVIKGLVLLFINFFFMMLFFIGYSILIGFLLH